MRPYTFAIYPTIIRGPPGARGPTGSAGPTGASGRNGSQGSRGITGVDGPTGAAYVGTAATSPIDIGTILVPSSITFTFSPSYLTYSPGMFVDLEASSGSIVCLLNTFNNITSQATATVISKTGSGTFSSWDLGFTATGGPTGPTGFKGRTGSSGPSDSYDTTSSSSLVPSNYTIGASLTGVMGTGLSYIPGQSIRLTPIPPISSSSYLSGFLTDYNIASGGFTINPLDNVFIYPSPISSWTVVPDGVVGGTGPAGPDGVTGAIGPTGVGGNLTPLSIGGYSGFTGYLLPYSEGETPLDMIWNSDGTTTTTQFYNGSTNLVLNVQGSFGAAAKYFNITHPTKENYRLLHTSLESPTPGETLYKYKVNVTKTRAYVKLPEYFSYLNSKDSTMVLVSGEGHFGTGYGWVENDKCVIMTSEPGVYNVVIMSTRTDEGALTSWKGVEYSV